MEATNRKEVTGTIDFRIMEGRYRERQIDSRGNIKVSYKEMNDSRSLRVLYKKKGTRRSLVEFTKRLNNNYYTTTASDCALFLIFLAISFIIISDVVSSESRLHHSDHQHQHRYTKGTALARHRRDKTIDSPMLQTHDHPVFRYLPQQRHNYKHSHPEQTALLENQIETLREPSSHESMQVIDERNNYGNEHSRNRVRRKNQHRHHDVQRRSSRRPNVGASESSSPMNAIQNSGLEPDAFRSRNLWTLVTSGLAGGQKEWSVGDDDLLIEGVDGDLLDDGEEEEEEDDEGEEGDVDSEVEDPALEDEDRMPLYGASDNELEQDSNLIVHPKRHEEAKQSFFMPSSFMSSKRHKSSPTKVDGVTTTVSTSQSRQRQAGRDHELYDSNYASDLNQHSQRHHKKSHRDKLVERKQQNKVPAVDDVELRHHRHQRQKQLPIVVSISDNSFVSASPIIGTSAQRQREDADGGDGEGGEDSIENGHQIGSASIVSRTATKTSGISAVDSSGDKGEANHRHHHNDSLLVYNNSGGNNGRSRGIFSSFTNNDQNNYSASNVQSSSNFNSPRPLPAESDGESNVRGATSISNGGLRGVFRSYGDQEGGPVSYDSGGSQSDSSIRENFMTTTTAATTIGGTIADNIRQEETAMTDRPRGEDEPGVDSNAPTIVLDSAEDDSSEQQVFKLNGIHQESSAAPEPHYSNMVRSPNNELPFGRDANDAIKQSHWHSHLSHKASIKIRQEQEPDEFHKGGLNSTLIAILFGIGATGMLVMIVGHKMRSMSERVAYRGRRRSLVPDKDFLIQTIPI